MLTAITRRRAAFATNKVVHIVAIGLLYALISVTQFSISNFFSVFSQNGSHFVVAINKLFQLILLLASKRSYKLLTLTSNIPSKLLLILDHSK